MFSPWRAELSQILLALLLGAFLGQVTDHYAFAFWLSGMLYLLRHLVYAQRLLRWLRGGRVSELPQGDGIWEEIYYLIYRLRRRNKRRKKQLIRMLERFRTATAALPDATVVLGPRDEIDWFNEAAERMLGLRRGDIGQKIGNLLRYPRFTHYLRHADYQTTVGIPRRRWITCNWRSALCPMGKICACWWLRMSPSCGSWSEFAPTSWPMFPMSCARP